MTKTCSKCHRNLSLVSFNKHGGCKLGVNSRCRECTTAYGKKYYRDHREQQAAACKSWYLRNKETHRENSRQYHAAHRQRQNELRLINAKKLKDEVYAAYGGYRCACCGETEPAFLSIDHMNGGGNQHRKVVRNICPWLKRHGFPEGFQVLCMNCNRGKWVNGGVCPHQKGKALK